MQTAENTEALKINIILTALEVDKSQIAEEINVDRTVVSKVLSGERKTKKVRSQIAEVVCAKVRELINPEDVKSEANPA